MSTQVRNLVPLASRPLHERVAAIVRGSMAQYEVNQTRLAGVLGITQQSVSRKRSGFTPWTIDELEMIAPLFGATPDELLRRARDLRPIDPTGGAAWAPSDSNRQPTVYESEQVSGTVVHVDFSTPRHTSEQVSA